MIRWYRSRPWLLCVACAILLLASARSTIVAPLLRNLGYREWTKQNWGAEQDCSLVLSPAVDRYFYQSWQADSQSAPTWRALLRNKNIRDIPQLTRWIAEQRAQGHDVELEQVADSLVMPSHWSQNAWVPDGWSDKRCIAAWSAWNAGLVHVSLEHWPDAVRDYQAGIALAPGRVPSPIVQEYYGALAHYVLQLPSASLAQQLAAAKYLVMSGQAQEAYPVLEAVSRNPQASARHCESTSIMGWLQSRTRTDLPPWPVTCSGPETSNLSPEWVISSSQILNGYKLVGLDVDHDILDAGAEVVGVLYWQSADGKLARQHFRQPNLWPNSGNAWLQPARFFDCLPGYAEPAWDVECASGAMLDSTKQRRDPVGYISSREAGQDPSAIPDAFANTASFTVLPGQSIVYGGWWYIQGSLPRPHIAREYVGSRSDTNASPRYQILLDLALVPKAVWTPIAALVPPASALSETAGWLRPRSGQGQGMMAFDDVFGFVLPAPGNFD